MSRFGTGLSRVLQIVMLVGMALAALGMLAGLAVATLALVDPASVADMRASVDGQPVYLREPQLALAAGLTVLAACAFGGVVLWQLSGLLRSAARGHPFVADNVRRLRMLAALFATLMVVQLATLLLPATFGDLLNMREARLDLGTLFSALLSLVLAEVFRAGVALSEDAEGTI